MTRPVELFLSHSDKDRNFVSRLADTLTDHGVPLWYSRTSIKGAQQWHDEIGVALQRCDWFAVVLSPDSVRAKWVKRELLYALQDDRYENRIVPIVHRTCDCSELSWTLAGFQQIDLRKSYDRGCRELLRTWGVGYKPPAPKRRK